ncbi:Tetratricopeptide repeat [Phytophthora infestans]|uniref:Tetratricopeptide repeat n=1 Tax=Phytophthora infestans TaxID=4787 RepID=A0A833T7W4_PHYIN|nr:Tetratricopeptide repeat [Phytophthora infestans]
MESLSELKDALTTLGVSTATGDLRGQARRDELANRLQQARVASGQVAGNTGDTVTHASQNLDKMSLTELRSALELRQVSTQTPGLRGEARRHALVQRLININSNPQSQSRKTNSELESARVGSSTEDDETKSDTNSSVYSTANEFIYFDSPGTKRTSQPVVKMLTPQLSFTKLKRDASDARVHIECTESNNNSVEDLQRELFELRTKLHTARQEQQRLVDESLQKAGIQPSLSEISTKLQALERERRRLQDNHFGHELVKCEVLSSTNDNQTFLELVQEDALLLIEKHQETLKRLAKRTKEAMAVAKFHAVEIESGISTSARQEEDQIISQISHIESSLSSATDSSTKSSLKSITGSRIPTFVHYRSMPNGLRHDGRDLMHKGQCRQLHEELRSATSFRIRRDRVPLERGLTTARVPTQADKLGMKALFMEKAMNNVDETRRVYQRALELDENHAGNLGNYALFLCTSCGQYDEASGYFQRAITADSGNAKSLANYANFLMRGRKDYTKSEELYKRALKAAQKDVSIMGDYADLLAAMKGRENLLQAQRVLKKALIESPLHTNNQLRMASVLSALNENESAERCFEQLLAMTKQHGGIINRSNLVSIYEAYAQFLHQSGQWRRAKHMYDEALALDPQRPSLLRSL